MAPGGVFSDVSTKFVKFISDWKKKVSDGAGG